MARAYDDEGVRRAVRDLLVAIGEDPDRDGLRDTPDRVARAYREVFAGMWQEPEEVLTTTFELGLDVLEAAPGEPVRVYSPARTVVDLMRLRARIGESVAHIALRRFVSSPGHQIGELMTLAAILDVAGPMRSAVDVLTAS